MNWGIGALSWFIAPRCLRIRARYTRRLILRPEKDIYRRTNFRAALVGK